MLNGLLCKDPEERLTIEQLLQHPWVTSGGVAQPPGEPALPRRRSELGDDLDPTAGLRAAVFATILQQQVPARPSVRPSSRPSVRPSVRPLLPHS